MGPRRGGGGRLSYLPTEANAVRGLEELRIDLVGLLDDGGNSVLVLRGGDGQQGQHGQRDVVLAVAETALIVVVGIQAADRGPRSAQPGSGMRAGFGLRTGQKTARTGQELGLHSGLFETKRRQWGRVWVREPSLC